MPQVVLGHVGSVFSGLVDVPKLLSRSGALTLRVVRGC